MAADLPKDIQAVRNYFAAFEKSGARIAPDAIRQFVERMDLWMKRAMELERQIRDLERHREWNAFWASVDSAENVVWLHQYPRADKSDRDGVQRE